MKKKKSVGKPRLNPKSTRVKTSITIDPRLKELAQKQFDGNLSEAIDTALKYLLKN